MTTTCHVGTHLDAPLHFDDHAVGVEGVPVELCVGRAEVVRIGPGVGAATPGDLPSGWTPSETRLLIRTDSYPLDGSINSEFAGLSADLVNWFADRGVELIGIDTPSVDVFNSGEHPAHNAVLARGLIAIEGLWLDRVEPGLYFLIALPILLQGAEAAPVRAILKPLGG
jgi:arylformamidase